MRDLERAQLELDPRDAVAKAGVLDERSAVRGLSGGDRLETLQSTLAEADARVVGAFVAEKKFCVGPALVFLADQVLRRHLDVIEADVVDLVLAVQGDDGPELDARCLQVNQEERDA